MDYLQRIRELQKTFLKNQCDAFLVTNVKDIFYLTGVSLSAGKVLLLEDSAFLIVDGRYLESALSKSPIPVLLAETNTLWKLLENKKKLGLDSEAISYQFFIDLEEECNERAIVLLPFKGFIQKQRSIKDKDEISLLRQAAALGSLGFDHLVNEIKEGITEEELAYSLDQFWRKQGASGFSFPPIIAFGAQSSMPHYRSGNVKLKKGDTILIDIGVELNHYNSDMTRVIFFGDVNVEIKKIRGIVEQALQASLALCKPGIAVGGLDDKAREVIREAGYGDKFTHSLGHGVGLDIHEFPSIKNDISFRDICLEEGMVITIEPGIYLPKVGGVRLEDMIVITKDGYENLTNRNYSYNIHV